MADPIVPTKDDGDDGGGDSCCGLVGDNSNSSNCSNCSNDGDYCDDESDSYSSPTLFKLSGIDTSLGDSVLEDSLSKILSIPTTLLETNYNDENGTILFCCNSRIRETSNNGNNQDNFVLERIGECVKRATIAGTAVDAESAPLNETPQTLLLFMLGDAAAMAASISILDEEDDDECVEYITEEEAYQMWLAQHQDTGGGTGRDDDGNDDSDSNDVDDGSKLVSSPDGIYVRPHHTTRNLLRTHPGSGASGGEETKSEMREIRERIDSREIVDAQIEGAAATTTPTNNTTTTTTTTATTARQLERDPGLVNVDNIVRVHYTEVLKHLSVKNDSSNSGNSSHALSPNWMKGFGSQPIVIYGLGQNEQAEAGANNNNNTANGKNTAVTIHEELLVFQEALRNAIRRHGADTIVRTGNRETLVNNGFHDSKPAALSDAGVVSRTMLWGDSTKRNSDSGCGERTMGRNETEVETEVQADGTIVFNPIHEMPPEFRSDSVLGQWLNTTDNNENDTTTSERVFPNRLWNAVLTPKSSNENDTNVERESDETNSETDASEYGRGRQQSTRFTLCMANEGFGIGMHRHGPALFFLTEGRKKWYLSHPGLIDDTIAKHASDKDASVTASTTSPTHPGFYRELSTHKCLQEPGELLFVPNRWYHEIYNLASPTIGIQALGDELLEPGTLSN